MDSHSAPQKPPGSKGELLSQLIVELNISRRNCHAYPPGHPQIDASLSRVILTCDRLLHREQELRIAVARHALVVNGVTLDRNAPLFRDFARLLFERGIGGLTLRHGLTTAELVRFNALLGQKREELLKGGVVAQGGWNTENPSLQIHPVRYDLFTVVPTAAADEEPDQEEGLWERFARALLTTEVLSGAGDRRMTARERRLPLDDDEIDPRLLAAILNRQMAAELSSGDNSGATPGDTYAVVREAVELLRGGGTGKEQEELSQRLGLFISALDPSLRRRFLEGSLDTADLGGASLVEGIIPHLSARALAETLEDVSQERMVVQPSVMQLLKKLAENATTTQGGFFLPDGDDPATLRQKIRSIFREHSSEEYIPVSYRGELSRAMNGEVPHPGRGMHPVDLQDACDVHTIENQISDIIVCIMMEDNDPHQTELLVENLLQMLFYLLETGDYDRLIHLIRRCGSPEIPPAARELLQSGYSSADTLREMLAGMTTWGKSKYDDITALIRLIGPPFIEVLLDRLADEENISLRRFLVERIGEFGSTARDAILARLGDRRWYVLRNLIILLRQLDDQTVLERLRPLLGHGHPRVRQEALRCCLQFRDPSAERQILRQMDSPDLEVQLAAIQMADRSRSADVFRRLLAIVGRPGFSAGECELKSAAITTLAEIGREDALPALSRLLAARSMFNARPLAKLKGEALRSLRRYPPAAVHTLLTQLAVGRGEVARQAGEMLETAGGQGI